MNENTIRTNATVYFDTRSDPRNPGWVCETDEGTSPQFAMDQTDPDATDAELIAAARSFADGEITVRR